MENQKPSNTLSDNDSKSVSVVMDALNEMATNLHEHEFFSGRGVHPKSLSKVTLNSLFETAFATSPHGNDRDALRMAYANLGELQARAEDLQDAIMRNFGFRQCLSTDTLKDYAEITIFCYVSIDEQPFELLVNAVTLAQVGLASSEEIRSGSQMYVDIPDHLHERIFEEGVVTALNITFPRSDRYGVIEEATEKGAQRWLWDNGFSVSPDLSVDAEDSGDDTPAKARIVLHVPVTLLKEALQEHGIS